MNWALDWRSPEWKSGLLALAVHGLFFLLLVFGLSWRVQERTPVQAQIWTSLPPVPAAAPTRANAPIAPPRQARPPRLAPLKPATVPQPAAPSQTRRLPKMARAAIRLHASTNSASKAAALPSPPAAAPQRAPDLAKLEAQIGEAASSVTRRSAFEQVHDPHSLVARYYLAALLQKMQHVGNVIYTGKLVGAVQVRLVVGSDGTVQALEINGLDGGPSLEDFARQIVDRSAPFPPFPASLARETQRLKLEVRMEFLGIHEVGF